MIRLSEVLADFKSKGIEISSLTEEQLEKLARVRQEEERLKRDGGIWLYEPQSKIIGNKECYQLGFHKSLKKTRWIFGGNRSAKSHSSIAEAVYWATGTHPYRKVPVPNRGWIVSVDFPTSRDVAERLVWELMPRSMILEWNKARSILLLKNGSEIGFKSCEAGKEKFQGAKLHWMAFDEEPDSGVYQECLARLVDYRGVLWCAETPTLGASWTLDEIRERAAYDDTIEVFDFNSYWNKHIPKDELDRWVALMDEETKAMRIEGKHIQLSGLVFKSFDKNINVVKPFEIPKDWQIFRGIDHGVNNPTACLWVAVNREGEFYIIDEYYETDKTIDENSIAIKAQSGGMNIKWTAIDGSTKQRLALVDPKSKDKLSYFSQYANNGINCKPVWLTADRVSEAIGTINQLLRVNDKTKRPKLFVFDTCYMFLKEFSRYRWKTYKKNDDKNVPEKPQDYLNHAVTALYFVLLSGARWQDYNEEPTNFTPQAWY